MMSVNTPQEHEGPLAGLRVLELGSALTNYCGKLFAELGADVVLVEPPDGTELRRQPPFVDGIDPQQDGSIPYLCHNTSKRSVVVDVDHADGAALIASLSRSADVILDGFPPRSLATRGLGFDVLAEENPRLVMTSISPFGQDGPYSDHHSSNLVCLALGGLLWMGGYADGPPVRPAGDQAYIAGALFAAVGTMIGVTHAELTGEGQHVDVSVQEAVALGLENAAQYYDLLGHIRRRFGGTQREAGFGVFPCADGFVILLASGIGGDRFWANFVDWMEAERVPGAENLRTPDWGRSDFMSTERAKRDFWDLFTAYSLTKTKEDLYHDAHKWRVPLGPVNTPLDVYRSRQLRERNYFVTLSALGTEVPLPGAPYRLSETPWRLTGPAPRKGAHTYEVLTEAGIAGADIEQLVKCGAVQ